jgi:hypothetical protein
VDDPERLDDAELVEDPFCEFVVELDCPCC